MLIAEPNYYECPNLVHESDSDVSESRSNDDGDYDYECYDAYEITKGLCLLGNKVLEYYFT